MNQEYRRHLIELRALVLVMVGAFFGAAAEGADDVSDGTSGSPFGINDAYSASGERTSDYLLDLGVTWISDHIPRRAIEKQLKDGAVRYDFSEIDGKIREYGIESHCQAWLILNIESSYQFEDGRQAEWGKKSSRGRFIPHGPKSYEAYGRFLQETVRYINSRSPGWKVRYWSIDNEHASLFLPVFCKAELAELPKVSAAEGAAAAAESYADLLLYSARVIREVDPDAKIVFGGPGGGTPDIEYELYYWKCLSWLKKKDASGGFNFFDYHNFNVFEGYQTNARNKGLDYFRKALSESGFTEKPIVIKAGGTHSGVDRIAKNRRLKRPQTEAQQAEYLVKRFVYHAANGVQTILWGTITEDSSLHGTFSQDGLVYNGTPTREKADRHRESVDPGKGIKKLSYYAMKFLMDHLREVDWTAAQNIMQGEDNIYAYRLRRKKTARISYVVWWDYVNEPEIEKKNVRVAVETGRSAIITELLPHAESGVALRQKTYPEYFRNEQRPVVNGLLTLALGNSPVLVEILNEDTPH
ncbi:MAG: hypothetical protein HYU36_09950 [Planctomycetes bacterium]|nr:hypothetical protein [Planctomycetota bacterium]